MRLSLALLLGSVLLASCASGSASPPAATATSSAPNSALPFEKQWKLGPVEDMAVSPVAVYAVYSPASIQGAMAQVTDNRLARIDRMSGSVTTAGPFPYARTVAVAGGVVWMGGNNQYPATPFPGSSTLVGVDATSLRVLMQLSFPGPAQPAIANVAGDSEALWLAYGTRLYRLSAGDGRPLDSQDIGGIATSIALDPPGLRVFVGAEGLGSTGATVAEFDSTTLSPQVSSATGGAGLGGPHVATGADDLWISYATGMLGEVEHRKASDLTQVPVAAARHTNGVSVFVVAGTVWVGDSMAGQLMCLDPNTGAVRVMWDTQNGGVVAGDGLGLYFGDTNGVEMLKLDARCR
jgi:outer membrane protein assembly factor BamB